MKGFIMKRRLMYSQGHIVTFCDQHVATMWLPLKVRQQRSRGDRA